MFSSGIPFDRYLSVSSSFGYADGMYYYSTTKNGRYQCRHLEYFFFTRLRNADEFDDIEVAEMYDAYTEAFARSREEIF